MQWRKILVLSTLALALFFLSGAVLYKSFRPLDPLIVNTEGQPSIGKGKIEVVLIEDFLCENCRNFSEKVFPEISSQYLNTGKIRFTVVPVAFIEGSKPLANAALGVYHASPGRFVPFVQELFQADGSGKVAILEAAARVGGIDLYTLAECIDTRLYYDELEKNYHWAKKLMGKHFGTPALYVNGIRTPPTYESIAYQIERIEGIL